MKYIDKNLIHGEHIIYRTRLHPIIFFWPVIFLAGFIICLIFNKADWAFLGMLCLPLALLTFIIKLVSYKTSEFGITNNRVIVKLGFVRRKSVEISLSKIESIIVRQTILGRIIGYGTVVVGGVGGLKEPFRFISKPITLRKIIQEIICGVEGLEDKEAWKRELDAISKKKAPQV